MRIYVLADDYAGYEVRGLYAQHGLSILVEVSINGISRYILLDTGQNGNAVLHNAKLMGLDLDKIDVIVFSHSHYDHTGGLIDILKNLSSKQRILVAHPDIAKPALYIGPHGIRSIGLPYTLEKLREYGVTPVLVREPMKVFDGVWFLGEIPRTRKDLVVELKDVYTVENGKLVPHSILDDTAIAIDVKKHGVIVITGCSHSGIVNIVLHAKEVLGKQVKTVIGGLHLVSADKDLIENVVRELQKQGVEEVIAGHCTGLIAEYMFMERYRDRFKLLHVGMQISYP